MTKSGTLGTEGGNTKTPSVKLEKISKSTSKGSERASGAKAWTFTWNNYPENWVAQLAPTFEGCEWIGGYEIGEEEGTPHIQGYVEFPLRVRPIGYKGAPNQIHWGDKDGKPARGSRAHNVHYCTKQGKGFEGTLRPPRPLPVIELYGWQLECKAAFEAEADDRAIHWWWSKGGKRGKSSMVRWLATNQALVCSGKASDMKYMIVKYREKHGDFPETVVFDVPRSMQNYLSYQGLEEIKNGVFASTKYECEMVVMPYPKVFVFANFEPDQTDLHMSHDRFKVRCVDDLSEEAIYECLQVGL